MAYTPNNNPYIPGDPYSYDLKWIVDELKYAISLYQPLHDEFEQVKDEFDDLKNFIDNYFDTLDLSAEVSAVIERMRRDGFFDTLITEIVTDSGTIESTTETWLANNITPTSPAVDASLSIEGAAADARVTGQYFRTLGIPYYTVSTEQGAWTGGGTPAELITRIRTNLISVENIKTLTFIDFSLDYFILYYDRGKNFLRNGGWLADPFFKVHEIPADAYFIKLSMRSHSTPDSALTPRDISFIATPADGAPIKNIQANVPVANYDYNTYAGTLCRVTGEDATKLPTAYTEHFVLSLKMGFNTVVFAIPMTPTNYGLGLFVKFQNSYNNIDQPWTQLNGTGYINSADIDAANIYKYRCAVALTVSRYDNLPDEYENQVNIFIFNIPWIIDSATVKTYQQFIFRNTLSMYYRVVRVDDTTGVTAVLRNWTPFTNTVPKGKHWYILGDSISAGYYSLTDAMAEEEGVEMIWRPAGISGVGAAWDTSLQHCFIGHMSNWIIKAKLHKLATPAQGFRHVSQGGINGISIVQSNDFSDADLITVEWGYNDWHYNVPIGDTNINDNTADDGTTSWAVRYCFKTLAEKALHAKIIVFLPLNSWGYGGTETSNWDMGHALSQSGTLQQVSDIIKYWADYYGLDIIDLGHNNSVVNRVNIQTALLDGSHPSAETHEKLALSLWSKIGF